MPGRQTRYAVWNELDAGQIHLDAKQNCLDAKENCLDVPDSGMYMPLQQLFAEIYRP